MEFMEPPSTILIVDDEFRCDLYKMWIGETYKIRTATSRKETIAAIDDSISVCLLRTEIKKNIKNDIIEALDRESPFCKIGLTTANHTKIDNPDIECEQSLCEPITASEFMGMVNELSRQALYHYLFYKSKQIKKEIAKHERIKVGDNIEDINELRELQRDIRTKLRILKSKTDSNIRLTIIKSIKNEYPDLYDTKSFTDDGIDVRKHRPDSCSNCDVPWEIKPDDSINAECTKISSYTWICNNCGELHNIPASHERKVAHL